MAFAQNNHIRRNIILRLLTFKLSPWHSEKIRDEYGTESPEHTPPPADTNQGDAGDKDQGEETQPRESTEGTEQQDGASTTSTKRLSALEAAITAFTGT